MSVGCRRRRVPIFPHHPLTSPQPPVLFGVVDFGFYIIGPFSLFCVCYIIRRVYRTTTFVDKYIRLDSFSSSFGGAVPSRSIYQEDFQRVKLFWFLLFSHRWQLVMWDLFLNFLRDYSQRHKWKWKRIHFGASQDNFLNGMYVQEISIKVAPPWELINWCLCVRAETRTTYMRPPSWNYFPNKVKRKCDTNQIKQSRIHHETKLLQTNCCTYK